MKNINKKNTFKFKKYLLVCITVLPFADSAYCYIDPGFGLFFLQGVLAGIVTVCVFIRNPIKTIKKLFNKLKREEDA